MDLNFATSITCNESAKNVWQAVYTSQLYGTFFVVYAKFSADSKKRHIKNIRLRLVNYKGPINIGIYEAEFDSNRKKVKLRETPNSSEKEINVVSLKLKLQGLNDVTIVNDPVSIDCSLETDKVYYFEVNRKLIPLDDMNPFKGNVFDTEFYYRDGLRPPIPKNWEEIEGLGDDKDEVEDDGVAKGPGGICPRGYGKITF